MNIYPQKKADRKERRRKIYYSGLNMVLLICWLIMLYNTINYMLIFLHIQIIFVSL